MTSAPVGRRARQRNGAVAVNLVVRAVILVIAAEALLTPDDPRFTGNGIAVRDLVLAAAALTLVAPALHLVRGRRQPYPLVTDTLLLSIVAVDLVLNHLDLYNQPYRFDLIAHGYGPGAAVLALGSAGVGSVASVVVVNLGHVLLEIQEALGDIVFGTSNVRGAWDTAGDLAAGLVTSIAAGLWIRRRHGPSILRDRAMRHSRAPAT